MSSAYTYYELLKKQEFMNEALVEAKKAFIEGDAPIGAVIVKDDKIIARGRNQVEKTQNPTAHAEILAINEAVKTIGDKFLHECDIYITLEPCPMCAGAIMLARMRTVAFGAFEPKMGAVSSIYSIIQDSRLNHQCNVIYGLLQEESSDLLKKFFRDLR